MPQERFNEHAYTVRLFMPHGDPDGLRVIDQPNWSGVGVAFPRAAYKAVSQRDEFGRTGVYILVEPVPMGARCLASTSVRVIASRRGWMHTTRTKTSGSGQCSSSVRITRSTWPPPNIESRLIERARAAKRSHLDNGNEPAGPNLSDADAADADSFLRTMLRVLPLLGISAFEQKEAKTTSAERTLLFITPKSKAIKVQGYAQPGGFIVCAGSQAVTKESGAIHAYMAAIRRDLLAQGVMVADGDTYRFTQDYDLGSPSTAAGVLLGRAANGRLEWRDGGGRTLKSIQEEEAVG